ncbi:hypothetical protein QZH56_13910 [Streptomyces olivoreticuli]|uniref:hypothetical protein n=1 Tax=Streptomyces olivoreticuli TaxID=68246 RepID=UPI00265A7F05|nr:hypothetical protein [Streptomyces olivoreticuli]WKK26586.1 hypothetical protein QZH56_13910 [Streptomyces olivoreticuli]
MPTDPAIHPHQILTTPNGERVEIDDAMVPIVRELWRLGFTTTGCCQDVGEATAGVRAQRETPLGYGGDPFIDYHRGWALLKLPIPDAMRLLAMLADVPTFRDRVRDRWRPGSWRMNVPLEPDGLADSALLHFRQQQIPELTDTLRNQ